jgi:hypothetical protein
MERISADKSAVIRPIRSIRVLFLIGPSAKAVPASQDEISE